VQVISGEYKHKALEAVEGRITLIMVKMVIIITCFLYLQEVLDITEVTNVPLSLLKLPLMPKCSKDNLSMKP
jgi:hypothetical protein